MRRSWVRDRGITTRLVAATLTVVTFWGMTATHADPADIFTVGAPAIGSAPPKAADIHDGDASVSATGALAFSYPIVVPPGRNGMQPGIALSYSSQGPIYGTVAAGWSLSGIPSITLDTSRGRLWSMNQISLREYKSGLAGDRRMIATSEPTPTGTQSFRAQNDATFTRYQLNGAGIAFQWWRALSPDGTIYYFGGTPDTNINHFSGCTTISDENAPLAQTGDSFNNIVDYFYEPGVAGECRISHIDWGRNDVAGVRSFATLMFHYSNSPPACAGVNVGSQSSYRTGTMLVTGASELDSIEASVGTPDSVEYDHKYTLTYNAGTASSTLASCFRQLDSIQENASGTNVAPVTLPAVKFGYGAATFAQAPTSAAVQWPVPDTAVSLPWHMLESSVLGNILYNLGWGFRFATDQWPTVEAMMVDVDGDGLVDRLISYPTKDVSGNIIACSAAWERNRGPGLGFDGLDSSGKPLHPIPLPTLKWQNSGDTTGTCTYQGGAHANPFTANSGSPYVELCSLNYQLSGYTNNTVNTVGTTGPAYLAYRWIDIDHDGKVDLVASPATSPAYDLVQGQGRAGCTNAPPAEPAVFGTAFPPCPNPTFTGDSSGRYTMCNGMYPWAIFLNHGNGQFGLPASNGNPIADVIRYEPIPLESTSADSSITSAAVGEEVGTLDLDGDGALDGVHRNGTTEWDVFRSEPTESNSVGQFGRCPNAAGGCQFGAFSGQLLSSSTPFPGDPGPVDRQGLLDLNGDGLSDHWTGSGGSASFELNNGTEFDPQTVVVSPRPGNDGVASVPTGCTSCVESLGPGRSFIIRGHRFDSSRTADVDLDGRVDVVLDPDENYSPTTAHNEGASFLATATTTGYWLALKHLMFVSDGVLNPAAPYTTSYSWEIRSDMIDLDGDGIPEGVYFPAGSDADGTSNLGQMRISQVPTPTQPPRLLVQIDAQRGAVTDVAYAAMSNASVVEQHPELNKAMPQTQWVVQSLTVTNNLPTKKATLSTTSYKYIDPHFGPDDRNSYGFRGFEEIDTTSPSGAKHVDRYRFDTDWSGRLATSLVIPAEFPNEVRSIDETTFQTLTLFDGGLKTFHAQYVDHWTCANGQDETACRANTNTRTRTHLEYLAKTSDTSPGTTLMWKQVRSRLQASEAEADGDRVSDTTYFLAADADNYRLLPQTVVQSSQISGSLVVYSMTSHDFDSSYRVAIHDNVWIDTNTPATIATTSRVYDMNTGNVLQRWKPEQYQNSVTGLDPTKVYPTYYTYDTARQQFVIHEKSEPSGYGSTAPREEDYSYETGTGTRIDTLGPEVSTCSLGNPPFCVQNALTREEHKVTIDALGRVLTRSQTYDLGNVDYGTSLHTSEINTYTDSPGTVVHQAAVDKDANWNITYSKDETDLDGLGRPMKKIVFINGAGSASPTEVTTYHWTDDGTLTSLDVPNPAANDASIVTYHYTFDSLGRPLTMTRPDGGSPASGVTMSYDALTQTTTEQVGQAGGSPAITTTTKDRFGRLVTVDELVSANHSAETVYGYDAADRVNTITDPEGHATSIGFDLAGRRTSITRGTRVWTYGYDRNGNMTSIVTPCTGTNCAATHTTTIAYDNLDEPTSKLIAPRDMSSTDLRYFGVDHEQLRWDYFPAGGANRKGVLSYWLTYGPSAGAAKVETSYAYDQARNVTGLWEFFNDSLGGYSAMSRHPTYSYHLSSAPFQEKFDDAVGGSNTTTSTTWIDGRGFPSQMQVAAQPRTTQTIAVATRNIAGLVTKQRTDQTGTMPFIESDWTYDHLGRVTTQQVLAGPGSSQVVRQDLAYFGNDDPKSLDHWLGASNHKHFDYTFDWRHQLQTVDETMLPQAFTATYGYGDAGRFTTATESAAALPGSDVKARDVAYHYEGTDPEEVTSLTNGSGSDPYAVYTYDDEGNQTSRCYGGTTNGVCTGESVEYLYDGKDQLRRATKKSSGVVQGSEEYWYDEKGNRVATLKRDGSGNKTELIWFIGHAEAHYDAAGTLTHVYSYVGLGGPAVARIDRTSNTSTAWEYLFHGLGDSTLAAVDRDSGQVDASFDYAPFGEIVEATDAGGAGGAGIAAHRHRMNDKYVDEVSDLAYYGARYYDKTMIGWTQADPLFRFAPDARWTAPRRGNVYAFSLQNPLRYLDPDGRATQSVQMPVAVPENEADAISARLNANEHEDDMTWYSRHDEVPVESVCTMCSQPDGGPGAVRITPEEEELLEDLFENPGAVLDEMNQAADELSTAGHEALDAAGKADIQAGKWMLDEGAELVGPVNNIVLGQESAGLRQTADAMGARHLMDINDWRGAFFNATERMVEGDPLTRMSVSVNGLTGTSTAEQVLTRMTGGGQFSYELNTLRELDLLPTVTFVKNLGTELSNPWK